MRNRIPGAGSAVRRTVRPLAVAGITLGLIAGAAAPASAQSELPDAAGVTDVMPAGFQIDSVVLNRPDGDSTPLTEEQYTSVERDGLRDTRVDLNNNGIGRIHIG